MLAKPSNVLKDDLKDYQDNLTELLRQLPAQKKFYFYATDVFDDCIRKQTIEALGLANKSMFSEQSGVAFKQGNALEDEFLNRLEAAGTIIVKQHGIFIPSHGISGKIDAIIFRPEPEILEIKTVKSYPFKQLKNTPWNEGADAIFAYLKKSYLSKVITNYAQLQCYLYALNQDHGYLIYFNKDSGERLDLLIGKDDQAMQQILSWFSQTRNTIDNSRRLIEKGMPVDEALPEKHDKKGWPCSWGSDQCTFWEYCHGEKANK
jgi:hypothetical protein